MEKHIKELGWWFQPPYGWTHDDVRDEDLARIHFGSVEDVCRYIGLEDDNAGS